MEAAAKELAARTGAGAVLVKGGHLGPQPSATHVPPAVASQQPAPAGSEVERQDGADSGCVVDVLYDGSRLHHFSGPYFQTRNTHGTGK